ncbi:VanW family protein [uncultured Eubacterium sp.]|uniref:VanW family protein n=1 Tax=uncultured Eubacterium sp. TaxID=165185 RepID=UPI00258FB84F|nr:VanW family protein [uncultured Eubacterium sp.]
MKKKRNRNILTVLLVLTMIICTVTGCTASGGKEEETSETTTETTTKPTTTEDLETTFKESDTMKVYPGLSKDSEGDYPYELATYTSYYRSSDETRTANLKAAVSKLNNIKIPDDAVFSFNQTVGKRTITAGYETAKVINGGEFVDGLGGGVCQVSSTLFECVLRANVEIVYRTNHSLEIGYVPLGGDATVQWNSKDFKFKNTLGCDVRIKMTCEGGKLTCKLYGKKDVKPNNVKINIKKDGDQYILTRTVDGEQNYRTVSKYSKPKPKPTTTKKSDKNKKDKKGKDKKAKKTTTKKS